jgi:hypothetical protein
LEISTTKLNLTASINKSHFDLSFENVHLAIYHLQRMV